MNNLIKGIFIWLAIFGFLVIVFSFAEKPIQRELQTGVETPFSTFVELVKEGKIKEVTIKGDELIAVTKDGQIVKTVAPKGYNEIYDELLQKDVKVRVEPQSDNMWLRTLLGWLPILLFIGLWFLMLRGLGTGGGGASRAFSFGKSRAKIYINEKPQVTFKDVAGIDEVKEEVKEIIDFLKNPEKYKKLGGRPPKGILLYGEPGVGKTLLAKAIAGEANVPFISVSGSDFVEMFVGVGAARVRDLFETAKKHAPCIIFIDELDALGRARGAGIPGGGNEEREQTLNQLLVEMDGFDSSSGIVVIGATNRPDILDKALLRPGRFDRQIFVPKPDIKGRYEILKVHAKNKKLAPDVDLWVVAKATPGFTGADLENLLNEAALLAARKNKDAITMEEIEEAIDRVMIGLERKGIVITEKEKKKIALHELGHAMMTLMSENAEPLHKVTIIPRGMALGVTQQLPISDKHLYDRKELLDRILVMLGGRAAEEVFYGKDGITTGAENDLQRATDLAYRMVSLWGMSEKIGPVSVGRISNPFLGGGVEKIEISPELAREIDNEVQKILTELYEKAKRILEENKEAVLKVAEKLVEKETLTCKEVVQILESYGVEIKNRCREEDELKKEIEEKEKRQREEEKREETPKDGEEENSVNKLLSKLKIRGNRGEN
ncbi:MAG TPA: ATP-dependent metallopeptidase FtsH/Yme1/Tma family protein [Aquifex aeolicus]|nr:ATP-dependent metallopeptidase FtsH/Yme1/Tma family protein [Aquificales bacterium]HIQ26539.1 ATP-dependent metallopeptidase FtsH/Yme1/Tma family protein [Aquifex aeolicus]